MKSSFHINPFYFNQTYLVDSFVIEPTFREDERGWFYRMYDQAAFAEAGLNTNWLQMNHSFTQKKGTIRGMHFQYPPHTEVKMLRCVQGAIFDVIVDLRKDSATFLQWFGVELSAANKKMLYIPQGFAHGFQTLEDNCGLVYQHSANYQPGAEGGLRYNDPKINIEWPLDVDLVSERDAGHSLIAENFSGISLF